MLTYNLWQGLIMAGAGAASIYYCWYLSFLGISIEPWRHPPRKRKEEEDEYKICLIEALIVSIY